MLELKRERKGDTDVVRPHGVYLFDIITEDHGLVDDELNEVVRRRLAREELELAMYRAAPRNDDSKRDLK